MVQSADRSFLRAQLFQELGELDVGDKQFVDNGCLDRYLRARNDDIRKAATMLKNTLQWRKDSGVDSLDFHQFPIEAENGKLYIGGQTNDGTPVIITRKKPEKISPEEAEQYVRFMCLTLNTAIKIMPESVERWVWILDLNGYSRNNSPPFSVTLEVMRTLANHYPERMGKCYIVDPPRIFSLLYTAIYPFIDHATREKIQIVKSSDFSKEGYRKDGKEDKSLFGEYIKFFRASFDPEKFGKYFRV